MMPYSLYLDIDSPTLAQTCAYDGYSSGNASATKSVFDGELSPQRWPVDFSTANFDFDFDLDDEGENPFIFDVEASSKGMALPAPPPLFPVNTENTRSIARTRFSPGIRRGPLSYYGFISGHEHGLVDGSKSSAASFTMEANDCGEDSEDETTTPPREPEQVSPLTPSTECFEMAATYCYDRPVSILPPTHPPTPAMHRFQIAVNSHSKLETSGLNFTPAASLGSDSPVVGSSRLVGDEPPRSQFKPLHGGNNVDIGKAEERNRINVVPKSTLSGGQSPYNCIDSLATPWQPQSAFSVSSDEGSHFEYNVCGSFDDNDGPENYIKSLCSDSGDDEGPNCGVGHVSANDLELMYRWGEALGYEGENTARFAPNEDEAQVQTRDEEPPSNSNTHSISLLEFPEYHTLPHHESFTASPDHDHEMFDQLGIALPLPPPSVQAPAWAGPQADLKTLIQEHLEATGQLQPENKRPDLKLVINNQIHFIPLADPQTSKSDPGTEGNAEMPQWLPSPETPTFSIRLQNKVKAILKTDKKKKENRSSVGTQKLLDEGFKSASLYTRRKRVDRAKIGAPVGPAAIEHDSNTQKLVAMAEEWRNRAAEGAGTSSSKPNGLVSLSTSSLPGVARIKYEEILETDDDASSVDDAFVVHTPLRPRSVLPDRDRRRRSRSLPGAFSFTADRIHTGAPMTLDSLRNAEEGAEKTGKEKAVVNKEMIDLRGEDEGKDEGQNVDEEGKRKGDRQATVGQQRLQNTEEIVEGRAESLVFTNESSSLSSPVTSIASWDTLHERTGNTLVYEDVLFELIPQRTLSGSSIWLGSDTVSSAGSSRKSSVPSLLEDPEVAASPIHHSPILPSTTCSRSPPPASLGSSNSTIQHTPPKSEYDSLVQARLVIGPATEIFIPVILEDVYCVNSPPPRVIYEETPQSGSSSGILPAIESPPQLPVPTKPPVPQRTYTLCSPGAGKANQSYIPLRQKSVSKPFAVMESIGSAPPSTNNELATDPVFIVPTGHPPLPLRRSKSQTSVRATQSPVPSRRPSGGDIISTSSLDNSLPARELQTASLSSQHGDRNRSNGLLPVTNALPLTPTALPSKALLHQDLPAGISGDQPKECQQHLERLTSSSRRLAPANLKVTLPSSPRPIKGIKPIPSPISIPTHNHSFEQARAGEACLKSPITPLTGKLIYSVPEHSPLPATTPRRTPPVFQLSQYSPRPRSQTYIYIPYTIPRIGGGMIEREHRLKLATGRAAKRARTCKGCAIQGGGAVEMQMWFCLEGGCEWELCGECIIKGKENRDKVTVMPDRALR